MRIDGLSTYEAAVSQAMLKAYGISWTDASGEVALLETGLRDGVDPSEFVFSFGEKYDPNPVAQNW